MTRKEAYFLQCSLEFGAKGEREIYGSAAVDKIWPGIGFSHCWRRFGCCFHIIIKKIFADFTMTYRGGALSLLLAAHLPQMTYRGGAWCTGFRMVYRTIFWYKDKVCARRGLPLALTRSLSATKLKETCCIIPLKESPGNLSERRPPCFRWLASNGDRQQRWLVSDVD